MIKNWLPVFVGLTAGLIGCANSSVGYSDYRALYTRELVTYAGDRGELTLVTRGQAFSSFASEQELAAAMKMPGWQSPRYFTVTPKPETHSAYRVVILFNPLRLNAGDDQTCVNPSAEPTGPYHVNAHMIAVFCANQRWASRVDAFVPDARGPNDPAFRDAMYIAMAELLPPRNPITDNIGDISRTP